MRVSAGTRSTPRTTRVRRLSCNPITSSAPPRGGCCSGHQLPACSALADLHLTGLRFIAQRLAPLRLLLGRLPPWGLLPWALLLSGFLSAVVTTLGCGSAPGLRHQHLAQGVEVLDALAGA